MDELTIVGKQQESFGAKIEATDRRYEKRNLLERREIVDGPPLALSLATRQDLVGFVEQPVDARRRVLHERLAVESDDVLVGIDAGA